MIYLRALSKAASAGEDGYPLSTGLCRAFERLDFPSEVTLLAGDNGSGKTTLLEIVARKVSAVRIDGAPGEALPKLAGFGAVDRAFRAELARRPARSFYFHAEGFVRYLDSLRAMREQAQGDLARTRDQYRDRSAFARGQAEMAHRRTLHELENLYENDLNARSHGEGFLDFYAGRLAPGGLYLMDEPEAALSYFNQFVLLNMIAEARKQGCQFIISTHSPVLLACPDAAIYEIADGRISRAAYDRLENVRFLKSFLAQPGRYLRDRPDDEQEEP
ncbi:MAG: AAA family ATPase [Clostridiales bacterium]|nr:AAA family ATPase [Clostridiales bacterium]